MYQYIYKIIQISYFFTRAGIFLYKRNECKKRRIMMRIAINGFGRIGRTFLRCLLEEKTKNNIEVVAINVGSSDIQATAHMFKYDTLMGTFHDAVHMKGNQLLVHGCSIEIIAELDPQKLP